MKRNITIALIFMLVGILTLSQCIFFADSIDYNVDVKPILNKNCIACHGGVKQSGGFSLLSEDRALANTESGKPAIIPGNAAESEIIRRLTLDDPEERMPYQAHPLSSEDIETLTKWINQGAKWGLHWSYNPLKEPTEESIMGFDEGSNSTVASIIDQQVRKKLDQHDLSANPPAEKPELLRRASLTVIGMPAPESLASWFLNGSIPYETLIDSLLALPSYGEKWTSMWLDIARYADTKGFERDGNRDIWRYRDYVINAFNADKPYNEFITEQIAGDLFENPTNEQYIATGFHRNTQTNDEGGTDNEEFRVNAVMDRVSTTWEGIMGTTMACVQCHGHPYDPFPHKDYYTTYAFFNNTRDADTYADYPKLELIDSLDQKKLNELTNWIENVSTSNKAKQYEKFVKITQPVIYSLETTDLVDAALYDTKFLGLRNHGYAKISTVHLEAKVQFWMKVKTYSKNGTLSLRLDSPNGPVIGQWRNKEKNGEWKLHEIDIKKTKGIHDVYLVYHDPGAKDPNDQLISFDWFYFSDPFPGKEDPLFEAKKNVFIDLVEKEYPSTLIMTENPTELERETHVFDRGNWQVYAEKVEPGVPGILPALEAEEQPTRLDFAQWIVAEGNPLTARTYVNRIWEQIFGRGLVRTVEDLGSQGDLPTHPKLLDYLATEFMYSQKWSTKELIKSILLSETFQQSSKVNASDPENIYLGSGPRFRLKAEQVRDQALKVSGLLSKKMYGPPVMPFQPEGIWKSPYSGEKWVESEGENQYRRALYTFVKRTAIYPSLETFDMAQRQVCSSRRIRTNTPLQALVTLNDPVYIEASKALAERMLAFEGDIMEQINYGYELGMFKKMNDEKLTILAQLYTATAEEIDKNHREEGITISGEELDLLAMTSVANAILNLDEMLNN